MAMRQNPLRSLLRLDERLGEAPSAIDFNMAIPESIEKQREANILMDADQRASAGIARDLDQANAVREARMMGFSGMNPLREQMDYSALEALKKVLLPAQARAQSQMMASAMESNDAALNREAQLERAQLAQAGQDRRSAERVAAAERMARLTGKVQSPGLWEMLFGSGEEETAEPTAPVAPAGGKYRITVE